jgi:RTX calcium-binding nonapeptide repeat (4 copies)
VQVSGGESQDQFSVDTLGGDDSISSGVATPGPEKISIDGGEGNDTSTYSGTAAADNIGIANDGTAVATFASGVDSAVQDTTNVESLVVNGLGGDDTVVGQNGIASLTHLAVNGGDGNDTLSGGDGDDVINGGSGDDTIDGNRGNDVMIGANGNDTFVWDPGDGSDTVEGQGGKDLMDFHGSNASEKIDVSANGSRVRLFRDVANITMDIKGVEGLNLDTFGSADTVTINDLSGTGMTAANVDLSSGLGGGDGAADNVIVNGTDGPDRVNVTRSGSQVLVAGLHPQLSITGSEPANDTLDVNTLGGKDQVTVAPDVNQLIASVVDLGADQ